MPRKRRKLADFSLDNVKNAEFTITLSVIFFMAAFVGLALYAGVENVWEQLNKISLPFLAVLLGLSLFNYILRGAKWHFFGERLGLGIPKLRMAIYYLSGGALTVTPGKLGTGLRLWYLKKCHNVPYAKGLPLMIMDPVTDIVALLVMAIASAVAFGGGHGASLATFTAIMGALLLLFAQPKLFIALIKGLYRLFGKRSPRRYVAAKKAVKSLTKLVNAKVFTQTVVVSVIGWLATVFAFWMLLDTLGAQLNFWAVMFVFSFSVILGGAAMTPGGLGGTEASMVLLLLALGVPNEVAITATLVIRAITLWFSVFIGLLILPYGLRLVAKCEQDICTTK